jgi:hypothetical protein
MRNAGYDPTLRPPRTVYEKVFCPNGVREQYTKSEEEVRKARYRGSSGRRPHHISGLSREEAKHFLLHDPHGRALQRDFPNIPFDELADHLCEASLRPSEKREAPEMDKTERMLKNVRSMGESEYVRLVTDYARKQYPTLTKEQAFCKVFEASDSEGQATGTSGKIAQQGVDDDEAANEAEDVENDALDELETLAAEERRRNPKLSKAQAFTKAYSDNPELAAKERRQNRPRA